MLHDRSHRSEIGLMILVEIRMSRRWRFVQKEVETTLIARRDFSDSCGDEIPFRGGVFFPASLLQSGERIGRGIDRELRVTALSVNEFKLKRIGLPQTHFSREPGRISLAVTFR